MSFQGLNDDVVVNVATEMDISLAQITAAVRAQLLKDVRAKGNLFGNKYAQKRTPLAAKKAPPQTQRIW